MKRPFKKLTAWLCCMAMLISFIPATALPVFAAESTPLTQTSGAVAAGTYHLESDLTVTGWLGITSEVTIDLNGHTLYAVANGQGYVFNMSADTAKLTIKDSSAGQTGKIQSGASGGAPVAYVKGEFILESGEITGWTRSGNGGMFYIYSDGTFTMNGGKLTGASATIAAVFDNRGGTINLNGGEISGNTSTSYGLIANRSGGTLNIGGDVAIKNNIGSGTMGGVIYNQGTINMTGGTISGNTCSSTAGYGAVAYLTGGTFTMSGGEISGNTAYRGGAIATTEESNTAAIVINGGTITGNKAANNRAATIFTQSGASLTITGGTVGYGLDANGNAVSGEDIWFRNGAVTISGDPTVDSLDVQGESTVSITNLDPGAAIKLSALASMITADDTAAVDSSTYEGFRYYTYNATEPQGPGLSQGDFATPGTITLNDNTALTAGIALASGEYVLDLNGFTLTGAAAPYFTISAGAKLTVKDSGTTGKVQGTTATDAMILVDGGEFVLDGGTLTGHTNSSTGVYGGAVRMLSTATFTMNGGAITGNNAHRGAAVAGPDVSDAVAATITINGGEITGNNADDSAAALYVTIGATVNITGGTIGSNTVGSNPPSSTSGHIWIRNSNVTISGGQIDHMYYLSQYLDQYHMTISDDAKIDGLYRADGEMVTIKNLTEGAEIVWVNHDGNRTELVNVDSSAAAAAGTVAEGTFAGQPTITYTCKAPAASLPASGELTESSYKLTDNVTLTGWLYVRSDVTVDLNGYTINTVNGGYAFNLDADTSKLTIKDSSAGQTGKIQSGASEGNPAVYVQKGAFILEGGEITGWSRSGNGGMVIIASGAIFTMNGGKLTGAIAGAGSAIFNNAGGTVNLNGGEISGNSGNNRACIYNVAGATLNIGGDVVIKNNTGETGGAIWNNGGTINMTGGTISGNTNAASDGGAIYNQGTGTVTITDGTISGNTATAGNGGAIYNESAGTVTISGGIFKNNTGVSGGAIYTAADVTIDGAEFSGNTATGNGGAVFVAESAKLTVESATITGNEATGFGGGIYVDENGTVTVNDATITGNTATGKGGAIGLNDTSAGTVTINGGTFISNTAARGNAIHMGEGAASTLNLNGGTTDWDNTTYGGVYSHTGAINVTAGTHGRVYMRVGTIGITGAPVIGSVHVTNDAVATIGALTTGAKVHTEDVKTLTIAEGDETVYTENNRDYYFKGDMGLGDKFVPGATVALTEDSSVGAGVNLTAAGEYTLDLAGYTLTGTAAPYFTIGAGVKLTVIDSSATKSGKIVGLTQSNKAMIQVNGEFVLNDGLLTGHGFNAVVLGKNATMTMNGGEISGNSANRGAGVTSGDVTDSEVTFTMNGGTIKDNICTGTNYRAANLYFFDPAMVTLADGATIGGAYTQDAEGNLTLVPLTSPENNAEIRGGNAAITGGTYKQLCLSKSSVNVTATISGAPKIELLGANNSETTIGNLTTGASIATDTTNPLTVLDNTVNVQGKLYQCSADLTKILVIGNSFGGDTINYLAKLGKFYGKGIDAANMYIGSQNFRWHALSLAESLRNVDLNGDGTIGDSRQTKYDGYEDGRYQEGLYTVNGYSEPATFLDVLGGDKQWDYVVLQNGVEYVGFEGTYNSDVQFLIDYIKATQPNAQIYFNQTWATDTTTTSGQDYLDQFGGSQETMYNAILANTEKFFTADDARFGDVVDGYFPIGTAIQKMRDTYTATPMTRDGFHLSLNAGRMIAGLTVMKTLFDIDLGVLTADDVASMFDNGVGTVTDSSNDAFDPTEENVAKLIAAVEAACGYAAAGTVAEGYADAADTANKQFNPDAAMMGSNEFVAVYENVTEIGQAPAFVNGILNDSYATTGAGKIAIYKNGIAVSEIDELWLEENAGIVLTDRYNKIMAGEDYYIQADPQAPQLAVVGSTLYMTFDVKLYTDDGEVINGGVYFTSSTDGVTWTEAVKVSDAPMAYGLTALSDGTLLLSVTDTSTKVLKLTTAGAVTNTVKLDPAIADVAFAEVDTNVYALSSNGTIYASADNGASWSTIVTTGETFASPDMVAIGTKGVYVTWADETGLDIYYKIWTIVDNADYGWDYSGAHLIDEYVPAAVYNNKSTGGQPATVALPVTNNNIRSFRTVYVDNGQLQYAEDRGVGYTTNSSMALESSLAIRMWLPLDATDSVGATSAKILRTYSRDDRITEGEKTKAPVWTTVENIAQYAEGNAYKIPYEGISAKEMGDRVYLAAFDAEGNQVSVLHGYTAKEFAYKTLRGNNVAAKMSRLLVDMLNYGAAAQKDFKYNVDNPVNADLSEAEKAFASELVTIDESLSAGVVTADVAKSLVTVSAESVVVLNLKYAVTGDLKEQIQNAAYATIDYTDHNGVALAGEARKINLVDGLANTTVTKEVHIESLSAADARTLVTVRLHNADGSEIVGSERTVKISGFAYDLLKKGYNPNTANHAITMSLMQYSDSAYYYFHDKLPY